jgi:hypothetical protein
MSEPYYESARQEILERVRLRDTLLMFYLGGLGAYLALLFGRHASNACHHIAMDSIAIIPLPFFSLIMSLVILNHHAQIAYMVRYLNVEYRPSLSANARRLWWERSVSVTADQPWHKYSRTVAQATVLILPLSYEFFYWPYLEAQCPDEMNDNLRRLNLVTALASTAVAVMSPESITWRTRSGTTSRSYCLPETFKVRGLAAVGVLVVVEDRSPGIPAGPFLFRHWS